MEKEEKIVNGRVIRHEKGSLPTIAELVHPGENFVLPEKPKETKESDKDSKEVVKIKYVRKPKETQTKNSSSKAKSQSKSKNFSSKNLQIEDKMKQMNMDIIPKQDENEEDELFSSKEPTVNRNIGNPGKTRNQFPKKLLSKLKDAKGEGIIMAETKPKKRRGRPPKKKPIEEAIEVNGQSPEDMAALEKAQDMAAMEALQDQEKQEISSDYLPTGQQMVKTASETLLCVVMVDKSGSMEGNMDQIIAGLNQLKSDLEKDEMAKANVRIAIITYGGAVSVTQPFVPLGEYQPPSIDDPRYKAYGGTPMIGSFVKALDLIKSEEHKIFSQGTPLKRAFLINATDGNPNNDDDTNKVIEQVKSRVLDKKLLLFNFGTETANFQFLNKFKIHEDLLPANVTSPVIGKIKNQNFTNFFTWLSRSLGSASIGDGKYYDEGFQKEFDITFDGEF